MFARKQGVFSVLRWGIFIIVDKLFLEVWGGEKKKLSFRPKQKNAWDFFPFVRELAFFLLEKKKARLGEFYARALWKFTSVPSYFFKITLLPSQFLVNSFSKA